MKTKCLAFFVLLTLSFLVYIPSTFAAICENGTTLSVSEAAQAKNEGSLRFDISIDYQKNNMTANVINDTICAVPVSLAIFKMFGPFSQDTLSTQQYFSGSPTTIVQATSSQSLSANIPDCMAQYDVFYGDAPHELINNYYYENLLLADQIRIDQICTTTPQTVATSSITVIKKVINDNGGTSTSQQFTINIKKDDAHISGSPFQGVDEPGKLFELPAGSYIVSEDASSTYSSNFGGDCDSAGNISLGVNEHKTCTITNNDIQVNTATITPTVTRVVETPPPSTSRGGGSRKRIIVQPEPSYVPVLTQINYAVPPTPEFVQLPDSGLDPEMTEKIMLFVMLLFFAGAYSLFLYSIKIVKSTK